MSYLRRRCCTCGGPTVLFTATTEDTQVDASLARLDPITFSTIVSRSTSGLYDPTVDDAEGIGGNDQRCWFATLNSTVFLFDPDTLALITSSSTGLGFGGRDVGGSTTRVWFTHQQPPQLYEFDPGPPPTIVKSAAPPGGQLMQGIGGDDDVVWGVQATLVYELSTVDFSVVRSGGNVVPAPQNGCGGSRDHVIWQTERFLGAGRLHRRNPADFSIIVTEPMSPLIGSAGGK